MSKNPSQALIPAGVIEHRIYLLRNHKVMLDHDLAHLYGVDTRILNQAVKRNRERFPSDFMFQLTSKETQNLRSQIVTSRWGGRRYIPYAFTEQGVAMLSSVLKSKRAIQVNIAIMRTFVRLRQILATHKELALLGRLVRRFDKARSFPFHDESVVDRVSPARNAESDLGVWHQINTQFLSQPDQVLFDGIAIGRK